MTNSPGILHKQCVVPVHCSLGQDGREVRHRGVAILASTDTPFANQSCPTGTAELQLAPPVTVDAV